MNLPYFKSMVIKTEAIKGFKAREIEKLVKGWLKSDNYITSAKVKYLMEKYNFTNVSIYWVRRTLKKLESLFFIYRLSKSGPHNRFLYKNPTLKQTIFLSNKNNKIIDQMQEDYYEEMNMEFNQREQQATWLNEIRTRKKKAISKESDNPQWVEQYMKELLSEDEQYKKSNMGTEELKQK